MLESWKGRNRLRGRGRSWLAEKREELVCYTYAERKEIKGSLRTGSIRGLVYVHGKRIEDA